MPSQFTVKFTLRFSIAFSGWEVFLWELNSKCFKKQSTVMEKKVFYKSANIAKRYHPIYGEILLVASALPP